MIAMYNIYKSKSRIFIFNYFVIFILFYKLHPADVGEGKRFSKTPDWTLLLF